MSENSPETHSDTSTSLPADSPARTSARPERELDSLAIARAFGLSSPVLLAKFDPDGWLPRMCQGSLLCQEQWEPLSGSWPDSAMWDQTSVYELQTSAPPTCESESSSWPTVRASSGGGNRSAYPEAPYRPAIAQLAQNWPTARREDGESCGNHPGATDSLTGATRNWLTPHGMHGTDHTGKTGRGGEFAKQATAWATPQCHDAQGAKTQEQIDVMRAKGPGVRNLNEDAANWQPPNSRDWKSETGSENNTYDKTPNLSRQVYRLPPDQQTTDGPKSSEKDPTSRQRLNPRFVEWLMGLPPSWTEL